MRRAELPRDRARGPAVQRDLRAAAHPRPATIGVLARRAAPSASPSSRRRPRAVSGSPPSSRSATRPTSRRTTCSSTGRTTRDRAHPALPGVVRESAEVRAHRAPRRAPQADPRHEERARRGRARGRRRRTRRRSPAPRKPSMRSSSRRASSAPTRSSSCSTSRRSWRRSRSPKGTVVVVRQRGRAGDRLRRRLRGRGPRAAELTEATQAALARGSRPRRAGRTPSTCSARRPVRRTRPCCRWCSRIRGWTPSSCSFVPPSSAGAEDVADAIRRRCDWRRTSRCSR